ncbi:MAG: hypothetical protein SFU56_07210 [Capsulimonadales bacterium]|nr:hypothetical protein [Capsulimonadales bacterium]
MLKPLANKPAFDPIAFRGRTADWRRIVANAPVGMNRVVVEWNVGRGPSCFVYPASRRALGFDLCEDGIDRASDERWADFLEFEFVPQVEATLAGDGLRPQVICTDQRPVQVMRQRRRNLAAAGEAKAGHHAHH